MNGLRSDHPTVPWVTGQVEKSSLDHMKQVRSDHSGHQGLTPYWGHLDPGEKVWRNSHISSLLSLSSTLLPKSQPSDS